MTKRVALIIEDDDDLAEIMRAQLAEMGMQAERASDGEVGLLRAVDEEFELVLLDLNLPSMEGLDVCREIRKVKPSQPIIMVTARSDVVNRVLGLELGADDYITKPFSPLELKARVRAVLRRVQSGPAQEKEYYEHKGLIVDFKKRRVTLHGEPIELTAREFDVISIMAAEPGKPFTREQLNTTIYGYQVTGYEQSISSHINRIRSKLEPDKANPMYVLTVRGVGYRFADPEQD